MDPQKLWYEISSTIKQEVSPSNFRLWFKNTEIAKIDGNKITLSTPSGFVQENLKQKFAPLIEKVASQLLGDDIQLAYIVTPQKNLKDSSDFEEQGDIFQLQPPTSSTNLNPKYTLDNFVVGPSNNVAYAAACAVTQSPGISYNPLFLYGGTGVGKTHLMLGIGNGLFKKNHDIKIIYCPSEKFMNDYVEAIRNNKMVDLRKKYRSPDVLLVDDIQFFSGREGTQEEFFHTFNELQSKNSQIVLTSDRPPNEIAKLEDRLKSRFAGGLMLDIQSPDFDTRVAILKAKCREHREILSEEVLHLLASSFETNIRELEGKLVQIIQAMKTQNLPFTVESVAKFITRSPSKAPLLDQKKVLSLICNYFNLNLKDLAGPKRQKELVLPRHIAMYLLCEEIRLTVEHVGKLLGGRDHTTVMHGRDRIKKLSNTDREVQKMLIEIKQQAFST